ncbi:MAG: nucleoside triphosphate pyrophosphohydrolase [Candidatus Krumholzibacteria bacterium]|nr:nucleoside triphosphate pyrophosphohydrolase [Candidatus Krumholzibacteria bacterium]
MKDEISKDDELSAEIASLRRTLRTLRSPGGCPWDRERTLDEMISYLIDEAYELLHAEKTGDADHLEEELGDVLFLIVFIHELMLQRRRTKLSEITARAHEKIVRRHPHVFGNTSANSEKESLAEWERIKRAEKGSPGGDGLLSSVPTNLPPLRRAFALQKKAAGTGFDWTGYEGVLDKMYEEIDELRAAAESGDRMHVREEVGDLLFTAVNLARSLNVDCESSLERTSDKFKSRFGKMESIAADLGKELESMSLDEMEALWQESKKSE